MSVCPEWLHVQCAMSSSPLKVWSVVAVMEVKEGMLVGMGAGEAVAGVTLRAAPAPATCVGDTQ